MIYNMSTENKDDLMIALLRDNARASVSDLARALNVSRTAAAILAVSGIYSASSIGAAGTGVCGAGTLRMGASRLSKTFSPSAQGPTA